MRGANLGRRGRGALFSPACDPRPRRVKSDLVAGYWLLPIEGQSFVYNLNRHFHSNSLGWQNSPGIMKSRGVTKGLEKTWEHGSAGSASAGRGRGVLQGGRALTVMGFHSRHVSSAAPSPPLRSARATVSACPSANAVSAAIKRNPSPLTVFPGAGRGRGEKAPSSEAEPGSEFLPHPQHLCDPSKSPSISESGLPRIPGEDTCPCRLAGQAPGKCDHVMKTLADCEFCTHGKSCQYFPPCYD